MTGYFELKHITQYSMQNNLFIWAFMGWSRKQFFIRSIKNCSVIYKTSVFSVFLGLLWIVSYMHTYWPLHFWSFRIKEEWLSLRNYLSWCKKARLNHASLSYYELLCYGIEYQLDVFLLEFWDWRSQVWNHHPKSIIAISL